MKQPGIREGDKKPLLIYLYSLGKEGEVLPGCLRKVMKKGKSQILYLQNEA
jgi:hypothetical protein